VCVYASILVCVHSCILLSGYVHTYRVCVCYHACVGTCAHGLVQVELTFKKPAGNLVTITVTRISPLSFLSRSRPVFLPCDSLRVSLRHT
jgi:hypothetical protein